LWFQEIPSGSGPELPPWEFPPRRTVRARRVPAFLAALMRTVAIRFWSSRHRCIRRARCSSASSWSWRRFSSGRLSTSASACSKAPMRTRASTSAVSPVREDELWIDAQGVKKLGIGLQAPRMLRDTAPGAHGAPEAARVLRGVDRVGLAYRDPAEGLTGQVL